MYIYMYVPCVTSDHTFVLRLYVLYMYHHVSCVTSDHTFVLRLYVLHVYLHVCDMCYLGKELHMYI